MPSGTATCGCVPCRPASHTAGGRAAQPARLRRVDRRRRRGRVMAAPAAKKARDLEAEIAFLTRALKAPTLWESVERLAERARYPLLVDEVGYIPSEPEAANLFFQLVSGRYERASLIVTC